LQYCFHRVPLKADWEEREAARVEFIGYMGDVFTPINFALLMIGTIGGLILGATPGLSPTMAVALLIPFTFKLDPTQGLILLGAAYTSTVAGGAVSAILLKIPGAPANIATTLDGHTMARNGQGALALQLSFLASLVGGVFGVLLLIFLTPVLAQWALAFGPSHLFWLAILGVTVIGSLDSTSVVKGLLSGCIGLWLATIGFDDIMGAQRFIFHDAVAGGINVIPALIGLFAIPQVITMFANGRKQLEARVMRVERHPIRDAMAEVARRTRALTIGTLVGSFIGLIPGVGGQIAGLVAYDQSRKMSSERKKFGTGHSEGIIAAESANNAMVGPSLVPLLTLSIPGSPTAAVLLGGLLIHGIFPGSDLFDNHPQVAWTFINSMLIGQIMMCVFGLYVAGLAARVAQVPNAVMAAVVLGLAVFGSYSVQHSMGDVYVMAALGTGMYFLERFGFSAAPLVLGLILGPIAEANFVQGSMIANATSSLGSYFLTGPLNLTLIGIVVASIGYSVWMELRQRRYTTKDEAVAKEEALS
jgi:putative tricarboxylic transport membrane protein